MEILLLVLGGTAAAGAAIGVLLRRRAIRMEKQRKKQQLSSIDTPIYQTMPEQYRPGQPRAAAPPVSSPAVPKTLWEDAAVPTEIYRPNIVMTVPFPKTEHVSLLSDEAVAQGFSFRRKSGAIRITNYHGHAGSLVIPDKIDGFPVNEIAAEAFAGNQSVQHLWIPETVHKIGAAAFRESALISCCIAARITELPPAAFERCEQLSEVELPGTLVRIGSYAFGECKALHSIAFPQRCRSFGDYAFRLSGLSEFSVMPAHRVNNGCAFCHTPLHRNYDLVLGASDSAVMEVLLCGSNVRHPLKFPHKSMHFHRGSMEYCGTMKFDCSDCISVKIEPDAFLPNLTEQGIPEHERPGTQVVLPLRCEPTAFPAYVKAGYGDGAVFRQNVLRTETQQEEARIVTDADSIAPSGIRSRDTRKLTLLRKGGKPILAQTNAIACSALEHFACSGLSPESGEMLRRCNALRSMQFSEKGRSIVKYLPGAVLIGALQSELLPAFRGTGSHFFDRSVIDEVFRRGSYLDEGGRVRELSQKQRLLLCMDVLRSTRSSHEPDTAMYDRYLYTHQRYAGLLCEKLKTQYPEYAAWFSEWHTHAEKPMENEDSQAKYKLLVFAATDVGNIRSHNEDNFSLPGGRMREQENEVLQMECSGSPSYQFAVCDGMGGEEFGEEASAIAAQAAAEFQPRMAACQRPELLAGIVNACMSTANNRICDLVEQRQSGRSGSTMVLVHVEKGTVYPFSIGDSRIYHFDGRQLRQITEDHTLAVRKLKAHLYTEEEARRSPDAHKLTYFLGVDLERQGLQAASYPGFSLDEQGTVLLCSDGITDMCPDEEIRAILAEAHENPAQALVERALANGGVDNATCVVLRLCGCGG